MALIALAYIKLTLAYWVSSKLVRSRWPLHGDYSA